MTLGGASVSGDKANLGQDARRCLDEDCPQRVHLVLLSNLRASTIFTKVN